MRTDVSIALPRPSKRRADNIINIDILQPGVLLRSVLSLPNLTSELL